MMKIVLPGNPQAQQRCRLFKRGNRSCVFDPQTIYKRGLKNHVIDIVDQYNQDNEKPWQKPQYPRIRFWFYMPIPKSMNRVNRRWSEMELLKHIVKPDVDNLVKLYLDVITGSVIEDDNSVQIAKAIKLYSTNPRTLIIVEESSSKAVADELWGK